MNPIVNLIIFAFLGIAMLTLSVFAVTTKSLLRSAVYLLLVLLCTAGLYLYLNYHFLAAVQVSVYAGGVVILFIFAIFLTRMNAVVLDRHKTWKLVTGVFAFVAGVGITVFALLKHRFIYGDNHTMEGDAEINMKAIGETLMGTDKYQYLLPFEVLSILLLAAIIGGIIIARKK